MNRLSSKFFCGLTALVSLFALSILAPATLLAAWPDDGVPTGSGSGDQFPGTAGGPTLAHDGAGGVISAYRIGGSEIRINRVDGLDGDRQWGGASLQVTSTAGGPPHVVADGEGGAWVAWYDTRVTGSGSGLYIQHYDAFGATLYSFGGTRIAGGAATDPFGNHIDVDATPTGNLILAWQGTGNSEGVWTQRILLSGVLSNFAKVSTDDDMSRVQVEANGEGAIVVWQTNRNGDTGMWANRVLSSGTILWGTEGKQVMNRGFGPPPAQHKIDYYLGNLFVTWSFQPSGSRTGLRDVYAQKLNSNGDWQWGSASFGRSVLVAPFVSGVTSSPQQHTEPQIVADGTGGCIIFWRDERNFGLTNIDIYGQRLDTSGTAQWTANGKAFDAAAGTQKSPQLVSDDNGGAIVTYMTYFGSTRDIRAKRVTSTGGTSWSRYACQSAGEQEEPVAASDGYGGVIVAWEDDRNGNIDTYVAHLGSNGLKFVPTLDVTALNGGNFVLAGSKVDVTWASNLGGDVSLRYRRDGFVPNNISTSTANDGLFTWTVPNLPSSSVRILIDEPTATLADSSDATFTICGPAFVDGTSQFGLTQARDVAVADFNENGVLDLAVAVSGGMAIVLGNGDGTFGTPVVYSMSTYGRGVVVQDFDQDGILDVVATDGNGFDVFFGQGAFNTGDGTFAPGISYSTGVEPLGVASADFNEDGRMDLVVATSGDDKLSFYLVVANGVFVPTGSYATAGTPTRLAVGDFNNDGISDVATTCNTGSTVSVLMGQGVDGDGDGTFAVTTTTWTFSGPNGIATGDFNEDGDLDLAVGNSAQNISVCLGNGDGTFAAPQVVDGEGSNYDFVVGDFTGDGITDLVSAARDFGQATLYAGNGSNETGDGTFTFHSTYAAAIFPEAVGAGDFNGDGRVDIVTANRASGGLLTELGNLTDCQLASLDLTLTAPNGGEAWAPGTDKSIQWQSGAGISAVNIQVSRNGSANWETLVENVSGNSWLWDVTGPNSANTFVRVVDAINPARLDESDASFSVDDSATAVEPLPGAPKRYVLGPAVPNPFNPRTRFSFELPAAGPVTLRVHDTSGRLVRTLSAGAWFDSGRHRVEWNGKDDRGASVASGVYSVRMSAAGFEQTRRAVLVR